MRCPADRPRLVPHRKIRGQPPSAQSRDAIRHLKRNLGFTRLQLRSLRGAEDEFLLAATAQNLKRLAKLVPA